MAVSRQKKQEIIKDLEDKLSRHKAAVFVDYSGTAVKDLNRVRRELRKEGVDMKVAKKTLLDLVIKKLNINVDMNSLSGQVAIVLGYKDEVAPAKIVNRFAKEIENLKILGGILNNNFVPLDTVISLAAIPSYNELIGKILGSMQAPMSGFANVLQGNTRGLVQVLNAISKR